MIMTKTRQSQRVEPTPGIVINQVQVMCPLYDHCDITSTNFNHQFLMLVVRSKGFLFPGGSMKETQIIVDDNMKFPFIWEIQIVNAGFWGWTAMFAFDKYPGFLTVKLFWCERNKVMISLFQEFFILFYLQQECVVFVHNWYKPCPVSTVLCISCSDYQEEESTEEAFYSFILK